MKSKQEPTDYRLFCVPFLHIDKLGEVYISVVTMETQADVEKGEKKRL